MCALCCRYFATTGFTIHVKKLAPCKEVGFFFWTPKPQSLLEIVQTQRDNLTVQSGAFTSSSWSGSGTPQGRITAAPCSPSLTPRFPGCSGWFQINVTSFFNLAVSKIPDNLQGMVKAVQIQHQEIRNIIFLLVIALLHLTKDLRMDRQLCVGVFLLSVVF